MPTVLVAGGAGFIGSHTCKVLAGAGYLPVVYDNLSNGRADAVRWGPLVVGNVGDRCRLARAFLEWQPVAVMHFAACSEAGESVRHPLRFYRNNVADAVTVVQAMLAAGVRHIVFSSSAAVYGDACRGPVSEDHPAAPTHPYGRTKLMMEQILRDARHAHDINVTVLRYFNVAGADPDGVLGENHTPETHLVPLAVQAALGVGGALPVFGTDYDTPDGTCIRDYVHVADLAEAHVLAVKRMLAGGGSLTANLGSGQGSSVLQVLAAVHAAVGQPVPYRIAARRPGDPASLVADTARACGELGWAPRYPALVDQVRHCAAWVRRCQQPPSPAAVPDVLARTKPPRPMPPPRPGGTRYQA